MKAKTKNPMCSPVCTAGKGSIKIMYTRISIGMKSLRHSAFPHGWVLMTQSSQVIAEVCYTQSLGWPGLITPRPLYVHIPFFVLVLWRLQRNTENAKQTFPEKELCGLNPNFHIHVPVSDLYIPTIDLPILLQEIYEPIPGILYRNRSLTHECGNWDWGRAIPRKEYINGIFVAVREWWGRLWIFIYGSNNQITWAWVWAIPATWVPK